MKELALGESGVVRRPSQPIIGYLAEEEKKNVMAAPPKREPVGFIGLDDDDDHGLERAFGGFMRKGQGGDSSDDRGGGGRLGLSLSLGQGGQPGGLSLEQALHSRLQQTSDGGRDVQKKPATSTAIM